MTYGIEITSRDTRQIKIGHNKKMLYPDCGAWYGIPGAGTTLFEAWERLEKECDELRHKGYKKDPFSGHIMFFSSVVMCSTKNNEEITLKIKIES